MNLTDLKNRSIPELMELSRSLGLEATGRARKQEIIFNILKEHADKGEDIYGEGVLEVLQDSFPNREETKEHVLSLVQVE